MVVFGAGASFDSDPTRPARGNASAEEFRPPLADQLFDNRPLFAEIMRRFPACLPIVPYLRYRKSQTVEQALEALQNEAEGHRARFSQLAAIRWYLRVTLALCTDQWLSDSRGILNHKTLFDQIEQHGRPQQGVCIVTFNYDLLIERGLESIRVAMKELADYTGNKPYKLFKLHGSVNWVRAVTVQDEGLPPWVMGDDAGINILIERAADLAVSDTYVLDRSIPSDSVIRQIDPRNVKYPAIAIPVENKRDFECPADHLTVLESCIPTVTKILSIGWRATEKPFLEMLKNGLNYKPKILAVAQDREHASQTIANIAKAGVPLDMQQATASGHTFSQFVVTREAAGFLQQ